MIRPISDLDMMFDLVVQYHGWAEFFLLRHGYICVNAVKHEKTLNIGWILR